MCSDARGLFRTRQHPFYELEDIRDWRRILHFLRNIGTTGGYGLYAPIRSVNPYGTVGCEGNVCVLPETDCVTIRFPGSHPDAAH